MSENLERLNSDWPYRTLKIAFWTVTAQSKLHLQMVFPLALNYSSGMTQLK
jgi:hypothetical protein